MSYNTRTMKDLKKTTALIIMDGWGVSSPKNKGNAITTKTAPNYFKWLKRFPHTELEASGEAVGLFRGQEGNSEAGHMNLGAGRTVKQDAAYIVDAIKDGTFFKNNAFGLALHHVRKYKTAVHLMGLLSNHNSAHSCPEHLYALLDYLHREKIDKVYLHLFTDGRDSGQYDAPEHLAKLKAKFQGKEKIVTIVGRLYAMDRNKQWERTKRVYDAMIRGIGKKSNTAEEAIQLAYNSGQTDEFIEPTVIVEDGKPVGTIKSNDAIFFFNTRSDRARQLTKAFVQPKFEKANPGAFKREKLPKNIRFVAMTDFGPDLSSVLTAYPSRDVKNSLVQVLCPKKQICIAEAEKFAHVTYFFNGGYASHFCDEEWVKVESRKVDNYATVPEMNAKVVGDLVVKSIESGRYDFLVVNFANPDMVGHTGVFEAGKKAVQTVDHEVERAVQAILKTGGQAIITADHGNIEQMVNLKTGEIDTEHSVNKVPCIIVAKNLKIKKIRSKGKLGDVAPTLLKMMGLPKPKEMTGKALF